MFSGEVQLSGEVQPLFHDVIVLSNKLRYVPYDTSSPHSMGSYRRDWSPYHNMIVWYEIRLPAFAVLVRAKDAR